jgi:hypothetical protein
MSKSDEDELVCISVVARTSLTACTIQRIPVLHRLRLTPALTSKRSLFNREYGIRTRACRLERSVPLANLANSPNLNETEYGAIGSAMNYTAA